MLEWHPYNLRPEPDPSWRDQPEMKARAERWLGHNPGLG
jgi:hypothetical protein